MLFSEPKIPQSCFQTDSVDCDMVSVLFSEPKIPQCISRSKGTLFRRDVSVLFSEPKIPQSPESAGLSAVGLGFSALQRAENSSMHAAGAEGTAGQVFQCSSASRKFLNLHFPQYPYRRAAVSVLFSEPKIPQYAAELPVRIIPAMFQCSSASRKFLNPDPRTCVHPYFRPR